MYIPAGVSLVLQSPCRAYATSDRKEANSEEPTVKGWYPFVGLPLLQTPSTSTETGAMSCCNPLVGLTLLQTVRACQWCKHHSTVAIPLSGLRYFRQLRSHSHADLAHALQSPCRAYATSDG